MAERITALGRLAMGTARIAAQVSELAEYPFNILDGKDHVVALADRPDIYAKLVRQGIAKTEIWVMLTRRISTQKCRGRVSSRESSLTTNGSGILEAHLQPGIATSSNGSAPGVMDVKATTRKTQAKAK